MHTKITLMLMISSLLLGCQGENQRRQVGGRYKDLKTSPKDISQMPKDADIAGRTANGYDSSSDLNLMYEKMLEGQKVQKSGGVYKICMLAPLSGANRAIGNAVFDGVKMAMFDANMTNVTLIPIDTESIKDMSEAAERIKQHQADVVIGPVFSKEVESLVKNFTKVGAPIITFSNNSALNQYRGVEVFGVSPLDKIKVAIKYAASQGRLNVSALLKSDVGGAELQRVISSSVKEAGGATMSFGFYDSSDLRIESAVNTVAKNLTMTFNIDSKGNPYLINVKDAKKPSKAKQDSRTLNLIITDAGGRILETLISQMDTTGLLKRDIMIISVADNVEPSPLTGGVKFVSYDRERFDIFRKFYKDTYQTEPNQFGIIGYDVMGVLLTLFGNNNFSYTALHDSAGFTGVSGEFRFTDKHLVERRYYIYEVYGGKIVKIQ